MRTFLIVICCVLSVRSTVATDWTEFRGPSAQGHSAETRLPTVWGSEKNVLWKAPIAGLGWSSPVVLGDQVFLTTSVSEQGAHAPEQTLQTLCLDLKTGQVRWSVDVFQQKSVTAAFDKVHSKNSQASPTPITDGKHLYVHFGTRGTACLTLDGQIVWKNQELKYQQVHGNGGSPVIIDDKLIVSCDGGDVGFLVALDRGTGSILWKTARSVASSPKKFAFGTPLLIEASGRKQIISQGTGAVYGYQAEDGKELWRARYGDGYSVIPRPVYSHGLVFVGSGYDKPTILAIDPTGTGDVTDSHVRWTLVRGAPHTPSPLVVGDELYLVSDGGIGTCVDAVTGKVHWQERLGGNYSASPLAAGGNIYFQSEAGEAIIVKAGTTYSEVGRNQLEARTFASYAVAGPSLLIRTEKNLYRIGGQE